jgi:threonine dehydrogenase-like Zn-dependent dehydrogenase
MNSWAKSFGADNKKLKVGDRVVVPFTICCGDCEQCRKGNWSVCERSNRTAVNASKAFGYPTAGLFGYSHLTGAYAGGQAEYVRVPYADVSPIVIPNGMTDEQAVNAVGQPGVIHWKRGRCKRIAWVRFVRLFVPSA